MRREWKKIKFMNSFRFSGQTGARRFGAEFSDRALCRRAPGAEMASGRNLTLVGSDADAVVLVRHGWRYATYQWILPWSSGLVTAQNAAHVLDEADRALRA